MKAHNFKLFKHSGIVTDLPPEEVPVENWTGGANIQFQDTATRRVGGYQAFGGTPSAAPMFAMSVLVSGAAYWIYCSADGVYVTDGLTHTDITPAGGLTAVTPGLWTGCILNGIPVLNNSIDPPMYWPLDIAQKCLELPGWPANAACKAIRAFKYHLFALNITDNSVNFPDSLWWSTSAEPGSVPVTWAPSVDNDAGDAVLADTPGIIIDGLGMRDVFVVYKDNSTYSLSYVAGQYVYTVRKNFLTSGIMSNNCIAEINGNHWCFTGTDVIRHDGQSFHSVIQYKTKNELVNSVEPTLLDMCCIVAKASSRQIWICIPEANKQYLSKAYVINTDTLEVGVRQLPLVAHIARGIVEPATETKSWDSDTASWVSDATFWNQAPYSPLSDSFLMSDTDSIKLWSVDTADTVDGQPMTAYAERLSLPINESDTIIGKFLVRVIPRISGNTGDVVKISVGTQQTFSQPITWGQPVDFIIGVSAAAECQSSGRLVSVRFEATTSKIWQIHSYKLEYVDQGLY